GPSVWAGWGNGTPSPRSTIGPLGGFAAGITGRKQRVPPLAAPVARQIEGVPEQVVCPVVDEDHFGVVREPAPPEFEVLRGRREPAEPVDGGPGNLHVVAPDDDRVGHDQDGVAVDAAGDADLLDRCGAHLVLRFACGAVGSGPVAAPPIAAFQAALA